MSSQIAWRCEFIGPFGPWWFQLPPLSWHIWDRVAVTLNRTDKAIAPFRSLPITFLFLEDKIVVAKAMSGHVIPIYCINGLYWPSLTETRRGQIMLLIPAHGWGLRRYFGTCSLLFAPSLRSQQQKKHVVCTHFCIIISEENLNHEFVLFPGILILGQHGK